MIGLETNTSIMSAVLRNEPTGVSSIWKADAIATAKRDLSEGEILDGEGGFCVWAKAIPARLSDKIGALPIGLAQNVKLRNSVRKDEIIKISDVDLIEVDDIIDFRAKMKPLLI